MKEFMYFVFAIMLFGILFGCTKSSVATCPLYNTDKCHQIGGSFLKKETYIACKF